MVQRDFHRHPRADERFLDASSSVSTDLVLDISEGRMSAAQIACETAVNADEERDYKCSGKTGDHVGDCFDQVQFVQLLRRFNSNCHGHVFVSCWTPTFWVGGRTFFATFSVSA